MLVIPPQMSLYMSLAPEEKLTCAHTRSNTPPRRCVTACSRVWRLRRGRYKEAGPAGQAAFNAGVAGFEAKAFRGCGVVTSDPYEVSDDQDSVQMLTRSTQVGEFYIMMPPQIKPTDGGKHTADLLIYDEESDKHVRISWNDAMYACCVNQEAVEAVEEEEEEGEPDLEEIRAAAIAAAAEAGADEERQAALGRLAVARAEVAYADGGVRRPGRPAVAGQDGGISQNTALKGGGNAGDWLEAAELINRYNEGDERVPWENLDPNCRIILARPFIEHLMHSAVLCVAGRDTGATLFGPADMQLSANTQVKTIEGHYTGHFKSVVTKCAAALADTTALPTADGRLCARVQAPERLRHARRFVRGLRGGL